MPLSTFHAPAGHVLTGLATTGRRGNSHYGSHPDIIFPHRAPVPSPQEPEAGAEPLISVPAGVLGLAQVEEDVVVTGMERRLPARASSGSITAVPHGAW